MSKVRINDLARELEVKSREILDVLTAVGVTEKKTHSSSLEADEAERVRVHIQRGGRSVPTSSHRVESEPKPKIDWSRVSKPGDVIKAMQSRNEEAAAGREQRPTPPPAVSSNTPVAAAVATPPRPTPVVHVAPPQEAAK